MLAKKVVELRVKIPLVYVSSKLLKQSRGQDPWSRKGQGTEVTFPNVINQNKERSLMYSFCPYCKVLFKGTIKA